MQLTLRYHAGKVRLEGSSLGLNLQNSRAWRSLKASQIDAKAHP